MKALLLGMLVAIFGMTSTLVHADDTAAAPETKTAKKSKKKHKKHEKKETTTETTTTTPPADAAPANPAPGSAPAPTGN